MQEKTDSEIVKGRRGRPRKEQRPAEILAAGFREFAEKGFDGARLDNVAARAGVAKGTLYLYYDSKEALFEAAVRSRVSPMLDRAVRLVDFYPGPTRFLLRMIFKMMYRRIAEEDVRTIMRIMIAEGSRFPALTEFYYREFISKIVEVLGKVVERGIKRGELRDGAASRLPQILIAPGIMAAVWHMTFQPYHPIALDQFLEAHIDLIMNGISKEH
jgi:AcrR family transcriptional regulator